MVHGSMSDWFTSAFQPSAIAVFGASNTPGKHGFVLINNLAAAFSGDIHPVHPREDTICGRPAVRSLTELKTPIDLAVIATPPNFVAPSINQCVAASVAVAVVISGGFAETDECGATIEHRFLINANLAGLRIIGPNCFGLINTDNGLNLSFGLGLPKRGGISLVTQSGAYCMAAFTRSQAGEMGFAKILALGNKADIDETAA